MAASVGAPQMAVPTPIKPGEITVSATITVLYDLE
jgi:uncharacterized protein YggE